MLLRRAEKLRENSCLVAEGLRMGENLKYLPVAEQAYAKLFYGIGAKRQYSVAEIAGLTGKTYEEVHLQVQKIKSKFRLFNATQSELSAPAIEQKLRAMATLSTVLPEDCTVAELVNAIQISENKKNKDVLGKRKADSNKFVAYLKEMLPKFASKEQACAILYFGLFNVEEQCINNISVLLCCSETAVLKMLLNVNRILHNAKCDVCSLRLEELEELIEVFQVENPLPTNRYAEVDVKQLLANCYNQCQQE